MVDIGKLAVAGIWLYIIFIIGKMIWDSGTIHKIFGISKNLYEGNKEKNKKIKSWLRI